MPRMRYRVGELLLDLEVGSLSGPAGEVRLRPQTFRLFGTLLESAPKILSVDELIDQSWGVEHVSVGAIRQAISELRQALGDSAGSPRIVETVHRRGYRIIAPVERLAPEDPRPTPATAPIGRTSELAEGEPRIEPGLLGDDPPDLGPDLEGDTIHRSLPARWWSPGLVLGVLCLLGVVVWQLSTVLERSEASEDHTPTEGSVASPSRAEARQRRAVPLDWATLLEKQGDLDQVLLRYRRAETMAEQAGDRGDLAGLRNRKSHFLLRVGELQSARETLEDSLDQTLDQGVDHQRFVTLCLMAQLEAVTGRGTKAAELLAAARVLNPELDDVRRRSLWLRTSADVHLALGELDRAARDYAACLRVAGASGEQLVAGHAHLGLAKVAALERRFDRARTHLRQASEGFDRLGSVPDQLLARCEQADLELAQGNSRAAEAIFRAVATRASELTLTGLYTRARAGLERAAGTIGSRSED